jgi:polysaccharide export outer membrane protein
MRYVIFWLTTLALSGLAAAAPSAETQQPQEPVAPARYLFVPGDIIDITISSHSGYDRTMTIQPDGRIQFPLAGEIVAAGLTPTQLAARIQEGLSAELVDPRVTVSLRESRRELTRSVSLLGAVRNPGVFPLKEKSTLAELLAAAGGPVPLADLSRITITRGDRSRVETIDLSGAAQTGEAKGDVPLEPGDLIIVPTGAPPTVLVMGEVGRPGSYEIQANSRVVDAISQAGGPTVRADLAHVRLARAGQTQLLDLRSLVAGSQESGPELGAAADLAANRLLRPGDIITVPKDDNRVYLLGQVTKPDAYPLQDGDHVFDLLTRAGGTTPGADLGKALLIRRDAQGQPVAQSLDLTRMLRKGDMRNNLALQRGDVILIPGRNVRNSSALGALGTLLTPFTALLGLLRFGF